MRALRQLPRVIPAAPNREPVHGERHPMRAVTRDTALDTSSWTTTRAREVASYFDDQARDWDTRFADHAEHRLAPLTDALARGGPFATQRCLDIGCGTGLATARLGAHFGAVAGLDLSFEMLRKVPSGVPAVLADSAALPIATASVDAVVLMNAFLFAGEVARVLRPDGVVIWVSAIGADTPIYLPPDDVHAALPGAWTGVWSEAGDGTWTVLRRAH